MLHCTNPLYDLASSKPIKIYESEKRNLLSQQHKYFVPLALFLNS